MKTRGGARCSARNILGATNLQREEILYSWELEDTQLSNSQMPKTAALHGCTPCQLAWMRLCHCFKDIKPDSRIVLILVKRLITSRHGKHCSL